MTIKLVHLSDIHFGGEDAAAVEAVIACVTDLAPDLIVVTGDLTLNGLPEEFAAARAWLSRLPSPQVVTPGNHDTPYWNLPMRALVPFDRFRRAIGAPQRAAFDAPGLRVRCLNSARGAQPRLDWSKGAINLAHLGDVISELAAEPAALKVFACHHPLIEVPGAPVTGGVHRGVAAAAALCQGGVDLILTGHVHNPFAVVLAYGDHLTYSVGAGTLSVRTRGTPAGFSLMNVDESCVRVTALGWTGSTFEICQTWTLARRPPADHEDSPKSDGTRRASAIS